MTSGHSIGFILDTAIGLVLKMTHCMYRAFSSFDLDCDNQAIFFIDPEATVFDTSKNRRGGGGGGYMTYHCKRFIRNLAPLKATSGSEFIINNIRFKADMSHPIEKRDNIFSLSGKSFH